VAWRTVRIVLAVPTAIGLAVALRLHLEAMLGAASNDPPSLLAIKWMHLGAMAAVVASLATFEGRRLTSGIWRRPRSWLTRRAFFGMPWWALGANAALLAYALGVTGHAFITAAPEMCRMRPVPWHGTMFAWCQGPVDPYVTVARVFSAGWVFFFGCSLVWLASPVLHEPSDPG
jgi:hypothetical protein